MLTLPIKKQYFDQIVAGEKSEEYRSLSTYYMTRFRNIGLLDESGEPTGDVVWICLRNGYSSSSPCVYINCSLEIREGNPVWGAEVGEMYYVLVIHGVKESLKSEVMRGEIDSVKSFILDTNILLSNGKDALYGFDDNNVYITGTTLQELDSKKSLPGELGFYAREVIRELDLLRERGDLYHGVKIGEGVCRVEPDGVDVNNLPLGYSIQVADNRIISTCIHLARKRENETFILVTNDISMRVNADQCFRNADVEIGIDGYQNERVGAEDEYYGYDIDEAADYNLINNLYSDGASPLGKYSYLNNLQFVILKSGQQSAIAVRVGDHLELVKDQTCYGLRKTYNAAQKMLLWGLLAPVEVCPLVIAKGAAGTGKTLLSVAAGIDGVYDEKYNKVMIGRSNVENRNEQAYGYLPGNIEEKMSPLIAPFRDNLEVLLRGGENSKEDPNQIQRHIDDMMETVLEVCPLVYIRGRSISHSFLILDEAQNTSRSVIRDVITRAGLKSKVVLLGDPSQIDATTLDRFSCGLEAAYVQMRGIACEITFKDQESVRSELAKAAIERMK